MFDRHRRWGAVESLRTVAHCTYRGNVLIMLFRSRNFLKF